MLPDPRESIYLVKESFAVHFVYFLPIVHVTRSHDMSIKIIVKTKTIALAFHGTIHYINGYNKSHKSSVDLSHSSISKV